MKKFSILPFLAILFLASCGDATEMEDYKKYDLTSSTPSSRTQSIDAKTARVEVCPYLDLGTADTVSYKENIKVCIEEIILYTFTDGAKNSYQPSIDTCYGDIAGVVFWDDIPAGLSHCPMTVLAETFQCSFLWGCEAEAEIVYKVRMRDNDAATGWSEWQSRVKSKSCVPHRDTYAISINVPITMNGISFGATVSDSETITTEVE